VTLEHYYDEAALRWAETDAVHAEHPIHNKASAERGEPDRLLGLSELEVVLGDDPRWESGGAAPR
jgi:hypothetical protein